MADGRDRGWRNFQKLHIDKKQALRRLRKTETASVRHAHKFLVKRWRNVREVRHVVIFWLMAVSCLIGAAGLQLYWDRQSYQTTAGALGGTYAEAVRGTIDTLNPLFADTPAEEAASQLMFSRLLTYDKTGQLAYDLASDVVVSDDRLTYEVTIRDNVKWHDGRALTADDVVYTVELLQDTSTHAEIRNWLTGGITVAKVDERTVVFTLSSAYAPFEAALTFPIVPKHILGEISHDEIREHEFGNQPVGSGPFAFRLIQSTETEGKRIVHMAANEAYYGGQPKLARFQLLASPDEEVILNALNLNEVNGAGDVSRELLSKLPTDRYTIQTQPVQAGVFALLNNDSDILSDKKVRKALQAATDTEEVRAKVGGDVPAMSLPFTDLQIDTSKVTKQPVYDAKAAARLLDEAGWKLQDGVRQKGGKELRLSIVTTKNADYERALETIIGQWRQLGVIVEERVVDASDPSQSFVQSVLQPRTYDVLIYQLTSGRDADVFAYWHSSQAVARGLNLANYSNVLADDILSSARVAESDELRDAKHIAFARQWVEDAPAIGLYQSVTHTVIGSSVGGVTQDVTLVAPELRYRDALYWTVGDRAVYKTP